MRRFWPKIARGRYLRHAGDFRAPPHRKVNMDYRAQLEEQGLVFFGVSPDGVLPEIVEIPEHPWFVGVQFHPN